MSTNPNGSSGTTQGSSSGEAENTPNNTTNESRDSVAYETHKKLLGEKKKRDEELLQAQKRLQELEQANREREEAELKAKEDFKRFAELKEQEAKSEREKRIALETSLQEGQKLKAVLDNVSGKIEKQYWGLIDLNKVVVDPSTGLPDEASVQQYVKEFETQYSEVIKRPNSTRLPDDAARGASQALTYEAWLKLPMKEQQARLKDVINL